MITLKLRLNQDANWPEYRFIGLTNPMDWTLCGDEPSQMNWYYSGKWGYEAACSFGRSIVNSLVIPFTGQYQDVYEFDATEFFGCARGKSW